MDRREALKRTAFLLGGAVTASTWTALVTGCQRPGNITSFAEENTQNLLAEIAETILPETDTPGAKAAGVGPFIAMMLQDCYEEKDQRLVLDGLSELNKRCKDEYGDVFVETTPENRTALLTAVDKERIEYGKDRKEGDPPHYFSILKELTLTGYFTSEPGLTQALRYVPVPGRYEGCVPYKQGEKAWA
ncbi:MAG TPA: gluconate 2-dehydrogenase subunit 3 family protein [Anseongella sp.]|nr:gluconate 2-dehydrogenase subunit 3 family protein [Anseongella sp.]